MTAPRRLLPGCALTFSLALSPQPPAPATSPVDLLTELASRIAGAMTPGDALELRPADQDTQASGVHRQLSQHLTRLLTNRGLRVVDQGQSSVVVAFTCSTNLRERVCLAEIRRGDARLVLSAMRRHTRTDPSADAPAPLGLEMRPLLSRTAAILDAAVVGPHLLALEPTAVTLNTQTAGGWWRVSSRPIASSQPLPRDPRGRLRVDGGTFEAFVPGIVCRGSVDPLEMACRDEERAWPIGIENTGVPPGRNAFTLPDGQRFFAAAPLGTDAGARWLVTTADGRLLFLDEKGHPLETAIDSGDEVVALALPCSSDTHVLLSLRAPGEAEHLRLFRVFERQLLPASPALVLPGPLTALWTMPVRNRAIAVAHNAVTGRHEAFQVGASCVH